MDQELVETLKSVLDVALQPIHKELKEINVRLDGVDLRLDGMDQRFDSIDQRLDGMDQRFDSIDQRLDGMDQRFDSIDQRLDGMDQRFDGIDMRFVGVDQRLGGLENELKEFRAETNTNLQVLQDGQRGVRKENTQRLNETQQRFERLESAIQFVNHKTADHDLKLHQLESNKRENL